jgi:hypothetical protein
MSLRLSCPHCHGNHVQAIHGKDCAGVCGVRPGAGWQCQECGESVDNPRRSVAVWPALDKAVGFMLLATFTYAAIQFIL